MQNERAPRVSLQELMLIPVGVSLNVVGYQLCTVLKFPVFVDQIGTYLVAMLAGPWMGLLTGFIGNVVNGMLSPVAIPFGLVSVIIGLCAGFFSRFGFFKHIIGLVFSCVVITIASATAAAFVSVVLFGGVTGSGTDLITATFLACGKQVYESVLSTNLISGCFSAILNLGLAYLIVRRIPDRFLIRLRDGAKYVKVKVNENE